MKDLLIGMGLGFIVGSVMCKSNKAFADVVEKGVDKTKEIINDISDEVKAQANKMKKQED